MRNLTASILAIFVSIALALAAPARADEEGDLPQYMSLIQSLGEEPIDKQIEALRKYLDEHPNTQFRSEIETNVHHLEDLLKESNPDRKREARDAERYLRAVEFAKKLSPQDQIALWEQYLEENPKSLYLQEASATHEALKSRHQTSAPDKPSESGKSLPVAKNLPTKDPQKAVLLATFPGLIVPGIAHWYVKEYATAGVLTAIRIGGLAMGIPGIVDGNTSLIIVGSILAGFSYIYDVTAAPYAVARYNENIENEISLDSSLWGLSVSLAF